MENDSHHEQFADIPDKYYLNQLKRGLGATMAIPPSEMHREASEYVDMAELSEHIRQNAHATPQQYDAGFKHMANISDQLWVYANNALFNETEKLGFEPHDPRGMVVALAVTGTRLAYVIDLAKRAAIGREGHTEYSNALINRLTTQFSAAYVENNSEIFDTGAAMFAGRIKEEAFKRISMTRLDESWSWTKAYLATDTISQCLILRDALASLPEISIAEATRLKRHNKALAEAANELQVYTPKPAIGEIDGTDLRLVFVDQEVSNHVISTNNLKDRHTLIKLFRGKEVTSSNASLSFARSSDLNSQVKRIAVQGQDKDDSVMLVLYKNRELSFNMGFLSTFAKKIGLADKSILLTSMVLAQYFDLVVPVYVVDMANEEAAAMSNEADSSPKADSLRKLVLARTRVLKEFGAEIKREISQEEAYDVEGQPGGKAKHEVVGFKRRLPAGYKATAQAHEQCREELGSELEPGWTYVRRHVRGSVEVESRGHKIVKSAGSAGRLAIQDKRPRGR